MSVRLIALGVLAVLALTGCKKSDEAPRVDQDWDAPPKMEPAEQARGVAACSAYVARLCACAETTPALGERCQLARSMPDALATSLAMLRGEDANWGSKELRAVQANARRVIRECFEADSALNLATCPRPSP